MSDASVGVYKLTNDFYLEFDRISTGFRKREKYGLGKDVLDYILQMLELIEIANKVRDKVGYINLAIEKVVAIKIRIRILKSNGSINVQNYERCASKFLEIETQLCKWRNWAERNRIAEQSEQRGVGIASR